MGFSYRKKKGPVRLSVSKRGPRVSVGTGCLLPVLVGLLLAVGGVASAHRNGCHAAHSCPSDTGSYTCGDTGNYTYCGGSTTTPAPTARTSSGTASTRTSSSGTRPVYGLVDDGNGGQALREIGTEPAPARSTTARQLPATGWHPDLALAGLTLLEMGAGLSAWSRRRRDGIVIWER